MSTPFWNDLPVGFHHRRCVIENDLGFEVFIWRGEVANSKVLLLNGATHGDEWEGPTFLTELAQSWRPEDLTGTVVVVPVLHEAAFFACKRESPLDGCNLARVFPGNPEGTFTEKIAHAWQTQFIAHASFYADFHSAGAAYQIYPWAGYAMSNDASTLDTQRQMAKCFPNVWHWGTPYWSGRTISAAYEHNVPAIYIECQGKGEVEEYDLNILRTGFGNLLKLLCFEQGDPQLFEPNAVRESTEGEEGHLQIENPSPCDGLVMQIVAPGSQVEIEDVLATVQPLDGSTPLEVRTAKAGRVIIARRFRAVRQDDFLAVVANI